MPDLPILEHSTTQWELAWSHIQWWASVSFGLIVLAHFAGNKLSRTLVLTLTLLYLLFTIFADVNVLFLLSVIDGHGEELEALRAAGTISAGGEAYLDYAQTFGQINGLLFIVLQAGMVIGTLVYLVHSYRGNRRSS